MATLEEIETGIAALKAQTGQGRASGETRAPRPRKGFPPHLERVEVVLEPEVLPEHAGREKVLIGEDVSERLDVIPAKFRVIVTRRPKYAFKEADGVIQALAPAHIIESGLPTEALLAQIAVSKYADGLPLFRQEGIYARDGVEITLDNLDEYLHETDLDRFLREALEKSDYPLAVRIYYLQIIKSLSEKNAIKWSREKTNRDYLRETREYRLGESFRVATRAYERVWYGNQTLSATDYARLEPEFKNLLSAI